MEEEEKTTAAAKEDEGGYNKYQGVPSRRMDGGGSILYFLDIIIIGGCNTIPVIQGSSMKIKIIIIKKMKQTNNNILLYILTKEEVLSIEFTPYYTPCSLLMYTIHHQSDRCLKSFRPMLNYWSIQAIQCHTNVHDLSPHGPLSH